jgi:hypothetical protein
LCHSGIRLPPELVSQIGSAKEVDEQLLEDL